MNNTINVISYLSGYFQLDKSDFFENMFVSSLRAQNITMEEQIFVPQSGVPPRGGLPPPLVDQQPGHRPIGGPKGSAGKEPPMADDPGETTSLYAGPAGEGMVNVSRLGTTMTTTVEGQATEVTQAGRVFLPAQLRTTATDGTHPDISFYLGKPVKALVGSFSTTDGATTFAHTSIFAPIKANDIMWNKLKGVHAFRCTTVLTLQVNATRFQAGRYILCYLPTGGAAANELGISWLTRMKFYSATQVTQLMHVELDLSRDSQVQLRIPYTCFANSTPVTKDATLFLKQVPGLFKIYPYMALQSGSSTNSCSFTLWAHYEDVELFGNMAPQMGNGKFSSRGLSGNIFNKAKDVLGMEIYSPGPVEKAANSVRVIADQATRIPSLSALAAPVSWLADAIGGVASVFGWSKPNIIEPITNIHNQLFSAMPTVDSHEECTVMGLSQTNHIDVLPGFAGTDEDELSLDYLKRVFAFWKVYTWSDTSAPGTEIFKIPLCPSNYYTSNAPSGYQTALSMTPVAYLSSLFNYYKGGLKFKVKIVKTEFHSGRLIFGFFPCDPTVDSTGTEVTYANLNYVQKTVIDVRDDVEWEIEVPYVSTTSFKNCGLSGYDGEPFGWLACYVQSDLISPDGVPKDVKILLEVAGSDDLTWSVPRQNSFVPLAPVAALAVPQMGGILDTGDIGTTSSKLVEFNDEACCIGEVVTSLRQLIKRPGPYIPYSNSKQLFFYPDQFGVAVDGTTPTWLNHGVDLIGVLGSCYSLCRGSLRFNLVPVNVTTVTDIDSVAYWMSHALHPDESGIDTNRTVKSALSSATAAGSVQVSEWARAGPWMAGLTRWGLSFAIPFYNATHSTPTPARFVSTNTTQATPFVPGRDGQTNTLVGAFVSSVGVFNVMVMRHAGDDFNFGLFTGIPPLVQTTL